MFALNMQNSGGLAVDVLSDVLGVLTLKKSVARKAQLSAPWGIKRSSCKHHNAFFFLIVRGGCYLRVGDTSDLVPLQAGDLIMSPKGVECTILDAADSPVTSIHDLTESTPADQICRLGGGGRQTT